ncbi:MULTISPECIES: proline--tRNA ligase [unclassified Synechocystis]|uniref:Proline--tRNA ligase n=1 Tax=Synechocystis sp. (strain ATCC 27184 / PCC 6803 / Kazusa) TaxID=1111708 RepID=SYP_SYNY3|nr:MULTISPECIES: proline--tRNA ligase [unclassified Synechocystis]P73942.2 RecName: Full=Proline--tRNA ligase; AltName: Full=Prolyl-tRNA synthetase; Short=ProRS [Synechocystis sp. PCC 6803 substr. Kazusa]ALJ67688.1 prolyl-tRNA synthetase [Synechocystis sp. PCC 6803]AVP89521.1 proline--tRNA ligase [Synechocystis sp. IPPAS B-1465]MBD2619483.1 proline--tRNA ligase [Synechocystis sp. FACHB-898]MBD2639913.1 proline--tRNA ligase [Synechocystis sp. FACHB-908]MBD2662156.1 proline--tRNA ligase [Synech
MRLSQMLFVTLRDDPADAEIPSHKLLVRAGFIRRLGSGLYAYLPLIWRVLEKVKRIVQEEMNRTGAQECLLPQLQPSELWKMSGRWDTYTESEGIMFALRDRLERELGLGPTHEEVITAIAKEMIRSYRQLPVNLYQIQTKFRDEIRPRFGLMRGREFIMKDAYSFHSDEASLKATYGAMDQAYRNIFSRCGLDFRPVDADSGAIGGSGSQEFMVLADAGEDEILYTEDGLYSANVEKAVSLAPDAKPSPFSGYKKQSAPNTATIAKMCQCLDCDASNVVKNVLYQAVYNSGKAVLVLVSIRGDQEVNEVKLTNELTKLAPHYESTNILSLTVPDEKEQQKWAAKPLPLGYISPGISDDYIATNKQVADKFLRLVDQTAVDLTNFATGADAVDYHVTGANWSTDFTLPKLVVDVRKALAGDRPVHDPTGELKTARGIEVGHIFQLGTKYSQAMGATFTNEQGEEKPLVMGCYGIGVSRLAQAAVEQSYDKDGIIWPTAIAPYEVVIVVPNVGDEEQMQVAEQIYTEFQAAEVDVLLDDRNERAGVKFKDSELIGIPYRVVTGKSLKQGQLEVVKRADKSVQNLAIAAVVPTLTAWIKAEKKTS